ncbi:LysR family transcriptional regulator, partial [Burkholderia pseudomallei 1026a]
MRARAAPIRQSGGASELRNFGTSELWSIETPNAKRQTPNAKRQTP